MIDYAARLKMLRDQMTRAGVDLVALGPNSHMVWMSGLSPHGDERPVLLMVSQTYAGFLMPALNADSSSVVTDLPLYPWTDNDGPKAALQQLLAACGATRSGLTVSLDETMRADFALLLLGALDNPKPVFTERTVGLLRTRKDDNEYRILKENALINDKAMLAGFAALKPGISEREVAEVIRQSFKAQDTDPKFTLVCFGANGAFPHHHTSATTLKEQDAVLIDIGGTRHSYQSDMTRVGYIGAGPEGHAEIHAIVEKAVQAAVAAAKPGVAAKAIDQAARGVIEAAGYGDYFLHRTGHGLGLDGHEDPYMTGNSEHILEVGNVFSIEPGIYLPGRFGIRLEEIVILREEGAEILSELDRARIAV
jgi:Xaa-Pro dipeptidase